METLLYVTFRSLDISQVADVLHDSTAPPQTSPPTPAESSTSP